MNCCPWAGVGLAVAGRRSSSAAMMLGVGSKRAEPVDDEAPQPGVGTVTQQGHDLTRLPHAKQSDRRPSLTFRQSVPGLFRDHRAVPDRGGDRRSLGGSPGDRESDHAIALRHKFPAPLEVSGRIKTEEWDSPRTGNRPSRRRRRSGRDALAS